MSLDKLDDWRKTHYTNQVTYMNDGENVTIFGWVENIRDLGGIIFIILRDREGRVQISIDKKTFPQDKIAIIRKLTKESVIGVKGVIKKSSIAKSGVEIVPTEIKILNIAKKFLPIDITGKIPASLDKRLNMRVLDLRMDEKIAIFKIKNTLVNAIREYLQNNGFIEIFTPKVLAAATEGGAALFSVDYFGRKAFLAQSPQIYKEILTSVFEKVYEISQYYRAEESDTSYHLNEFISVDIEMAFADKDDVMKVLEELIVFSTGKIIENNKKELNILKSNIKVPDTPFKRITYRDAIEIIRSKDIKMNFGDDIPTIGNRILGAEFKEPFFIIDWPLHLKPFYIKPKDEDPELSESFDLNWSWLEIASGGSRIHIKSQLINRLSHFGLDVNSFEPFLTYYDYGMPPHAGWGMGLQRLLMLMTGMNDIREVTLFPRDKDRLVP
ncbi:MAG: aspartate--tRNA(Asn) ligase [Candidatus Methanomethylicia archaeon]|nr:aspartate--tRNA(Asn) ligase [Candidatus Methanomethylicia archaeon]MCX8169324.1 aspartate--tRNA(Asn) ligase [Candidatus Methanomethylicia archaeon]